MILGGRGSVRAAFGMARREARPPGITKSRLDEEQIVSDVFRYAASDEEAAKTIGVAGDPVVQRRSVNRTGHSASTSWSESC